MINDYKDVGRTIDIKAFKFWDFFVHVVVKCHTIIKQIKVTLFTRLQKIENNQENSKEIFLPNVQAHNSFPQMSISHYLIFEHMWHKIKKICFYDYYCYIDRDVAKVDACV